MSSTGFVSGGFYDRTQAQIYSDYKTAASGVYEEINLGPGSAAYQLAKVIGARERAIEIMLKAATSGLSINTAYGQFLDKHGIEKGIFRKGPQKAGGYVHLTFDAPGFSESSINLKGTQFSTSDGKTFYRSDTGISQTIPGYLSITRGVENFDGLPVPYSHIAGTGYVNDQANGSGTSYSPVFRTEQQIFDWSGAASSPTTGQTYYVGISGVEITVKQDVSAEDVGTGYNVGLNTVVEWTNNEDLPTDTTVNNPEDITGGALWESDTDYRSRIKRAINREFSAQKIKSMCEGINGVRAVYVYQKAGADRQSISGAWSEYSDDFDGGIKITGNYSGVAGSGDYVTGNEYGQRFSPGEGIMSIKKVVFRGRRVGTPPSLIVALRNPPSDNYDTSGIFDTYDTNPPASNWQELEVPLEYLELDPTETYTLDFWCSEKSGASGVSYWNNNYWEIATGDVQSGNLGDTDAYTGLLLQGGAAVSTGVNSVFRTKYGGAYIAVDVAVKDGYSYADIESEIDEKLDWVEGSGFVPIGVDYTINQATPVYIYYSVTAYLDKYANRISTQDRTDKEVEAYVEGLQPGENVVYSQIYKNIINDVKVWRIDDLEIWESGGTHSTGEDIHIDEGEVAVFGGSTFNEGQ